MSWEQLPPELQQRVIDYLPEGSRRSLARTSRTSSQAVTYRRQVERTYETRISNPRSLEVYNLLNSISIQEIIWKHIGLHEDPEDQLPQEIYDIITQNQVLDLFLVPFGHHRSDVQPHRIRINGNGKYHFDDHHEEEQTYNGDIVVSAYGDVILTTPDDTDRVFYIMPVINGIVLEDTPENESQRQYLKLVGEWTVDSFFVTEDLMSQMSFPENIYIIRSNYFRSYKDTTGDGYALFYINDEGVGVRACEIVTRKYEGESVLRASIINGQSYWLYIDTPTEEGLEIRTFHEPVTVHLPDQATHLVNREIRHIMPDMMLLRFQVNNHIPRLMKWVGTYRTEDDVPVWKELSSASTRHNTFYGYIFGTEASILRFGHMIESDNYNHQYRYLRHFIMLTMRTNRGLYTANLSRRHIHRANDNIVSFAVVLDTGYNMFRAYNDPNIPRINCRTFDLNRFKQDLLNMFRNIDEDPNLQFLSGRAVREIFPYTWPNYTWRSQNGTSR